MTDERSPRERILEATAQLIEIQGYHATGVNQIVKQSQSPKGSLYHYFPDGKEGIVAEAIETKSKHLAEMLRGLLETFSDPATAIRHAILHLAERVRQSDCRRGAQVAAVVLETSNISERLRAAAAYSYQLRNEVFAEKLMSGGFSADRAQSLATFISSTMEGAVILSRSYKDVKPIEDAAEMIFHLLRAETPASSDKTP